MPPPTLSRTFVCEDAINEIIVIKAINIVFFIVSDGFDYLCRETADHGAGRNVFIDHRACCDNGTFTDGDTLKDGDISSDPHLVADFHRSGDHIGASVGVHYVIESGNHAVVPNKDIIANSDSALILEFASGIDEHPFADSDVLSAVGIEWREKPETLMDFSARQLRHQGYDLIVGVIGIVNLHGYADGLLTQFVHFGMDRASAGNNLA